MIIEFENFLNEELFDSDPYKIREMGDVSLGRKELNQDNNTIVHRYEFTTDKGYKYNVHMVIWKEERILNIGFAPHGTPEKPIRGSLDMFGNFETNKIFATINVLLNKHRDEFDSVETCSEPKRIRIYKELFKRLGYKIIDSSERHLKAEK